MNPLIRIVLNLSVKKDLSVQLFPSVLEGFAAPSATSNSVPAG